jgi:hypothetical protein
VLFGIETALVVRILHLFKILIQRVHETIMLKTLLIVAVYNVHC